MKSHNISRESLAIFYALEDLLLLGTTCGVYIWFLFWKKGKGKRKKLRSEFMAKCHLKSHFPHFCFVILFSVYNICCENFPVTLLETKRSKEKKIPE